jgi:hypothetical protein
MKVAAALVFAGLVSAQNFVTYSVAGNSVEFRGGRSAAELEWLSGASFRFRQDWRERFQPHLPRTGEKIEFRVSERGSHVVLESRHLTVDIDRPELHVTVKAAGEDAAIDLGTAHHVPGKVILERPLAGGEALYGAGITGQAGLSVRGQHAIGQRELILSSRGFGIDFRTPAVYIYDLGSRNSDQMRVAAQGTDAIEEFFYYGPTPKEILEERRHETALDALPSDYLRILREIELPGDATRVAAGGNPCGLVRTLAQLAMSARLYPAMDASEAPAPLAALLPIVYAGDPAKSAALARDRSRWTPYLTAYLREAFDRGFPVIHPLAMEFPRDPTLRDVADATMVGDELLLVPPCDSSGRRSIRLPMGSWTDLRDNREYAGRAEHSLRATEQDWSLLARSGSIVPVQAGDRIELHYFPKLPAEFFLYEPKLEEHTQVHAGPAGDFWRLEIESKVDRRYEWIMHHFGRPREIAGFRWSYDEAQRNVHVFVDAKAGLDHIVNIMF